MLLLDLIPSGPRMNKNAGQEYKENFQDPLPTGKELQEIQQRERRYGRYGYGIWRRYGRYGLATERSEDQKIRSNLRQRKASVVHTYVVYCLITVY